MRNTLITTALAGAGLLFAGSASALNYNYVQGGLAYYPSFDTGPGVDQDFFGGDVQLSFTMTPNLFLLGGVQYLTDDVDLTAAHLGPAYRMPLQRGTDLYGAVTAEYQDFDANGASDDDTSVGVRVGMRQQMTPTFELNGQLRYIAGSDDFDYFGVRVGSVFDITEQMAFTGDLDLYDGEVGLIAGLRLNFF